MQPDVHAIEQGTCAYIQDFHPEEYELPAESEPIIESIAIVVKDSAAAMSEAEQIQVARD